MLRLENGFSVWWLSAQLLKLLLLLLSYSKLGADVELTQDKKEGGDDQRLRSRLSWLLLISQYSATSAGAGTELGVGAEEGAEAAAR